MRNGIKRTLALLLSFALCAGLLPLPVQAAAGIVTIKSVRDLQDLVRACALDSYSMGLTVELQGDIDLSGYEFTPLPIFCGTFHGNNHTIRFSYFGKGSQQGFIRCLEAGAVVEGLRLEATIKPEGSKSSVGGLAGENRGTILNCTVNGAVSGDADVGGIVGVNLKGGRIDGCINNATVSGETHTGGIVGRNEGVLLGCVNTGAVNTSIVERSDTDSFISASDPVDTEEAAGQVKVLDGSCTDTGGVAGRSTGTIDGCTNRGEVGYPHTGYNVGGICGIQNGNVLRSTNEGTILGRKDIGGIVGQFEPYGAVTYGTDPRKRLDGALSTLSGLLNQLSDRAGGAVDDAVEDVNEVRDSMGDLKDRVKDAGDTGVADAQAVIDDVHTFAQAVNAALDGLLDDVDGFSTDANQDLDKMTSEIHDIRKGLTDALNSGDTGISDAINRINHRLDNIDSDAGDIRSSISHISDYVTLLNHYATASLRIVSGIYDQANKPSLDIPNPGGGDLKTPVPLLDRLADLKALSRSFTDRDEQYKANHGGRDIGGELKNIGSQLPAMTDELRQLQREIGDLYKDTSGDVRDALGGSNDAADRLERAFQHLNNAGKSFSDSATEALDVVNGQVDAIEDRVRSWSQTFSDGYQSASDDVDRQLEEISGRVQAIADGTASANADLHTTTRSIVRQMDEVRNALAALTDTPEKTVTDVSDQVEDESTFGLVLACQNSGAVEGDANVGGITGTVAPELGLDPEQDLDLDTGKLLVDTFATVKATLRGCTAIGPVTAKNNCAGGIAGRCEVGAILDCVSRCAVESSGGGQCGGIAGSSRTAIVRCAAQCDLKGGDSLGGIAGAGHDIRDCRAMTRILEPDGERLGAIAGDADGEVVENYFLDEGLAGLDGVNYEGKALPLAFDAFSNLSGVPADFLTFAVTFQVDGETVAVLPTVYGGRLDPASFPAVPERAGQYGAWEEFEYGRILRSTTVNAVYSGWVTTISSGEEHPAALAEGSFSPDATLQIQEWLEPATLPTGYQRVASYTYEITDSIPLPSQITLRISTEGADGRCMVALLEGGTLVTAEAVADGSYLVLTAGASGTFVLMEKEKTARTMKIAGIGGGVILLVLAAILLRAKIKKRGGRKKRPAISNSK